MNYPFWDVGIGYGVMMAVIAIVHVFISHFAIGGGLYLVVAESSARRAGDTERLRYLEKLSKFFVLVSVVFGALTGVGIWFIIGLLNPAGTEVLIHNFVWGWAIEWAFFIIEICAAIVYFYGWKRIYFWSAWMSLVVINGIISFMLTPGEWLTTGEFWDGFLNPTYWPALVFRTGICILLAGLYCTLVASRYRPGDFKAGLIRYNSTWTILGLMVIVPSGFWYWNAIPAEVTSKALEIMPTPISAMNFAIWMAGAVALITLIFGFLLPRRLSPVVAGLLMALGLGFFGGFEWMRESIRKPYVVYDYMYGNAVEVSKKAAYEEGGYLSQISFRTGDDGADLFRRACRSCHTIGGYKPLRPVFDGTDPEFIAGIVQGAHALKGNMPPFLGTKDEARLLGEHIWKQVDQRSLGEIYGLSDLELGKKVYDVRCGRCHEFGGFRDASESILGLAEDEYHDMLDVAEDLDDAMPAFTGDDVERAALIKYLQALSEGGGQ
jgi:mono/diheme cytochrome c family protein